MGSIAKCESPTFAGVCTSEALLARTYRQLDLDARRTLFRLTEARRPIGEIAERLGRHPSTIYREPACHPSVQPRAPQRRRGDEPLQAGLEAADAALEEGGQAAAKVAGLPIRGFFSSGVASWTASHMPVETAQNRARAMTRMRRSRRSGRRRWLSSRPKPRVLKSENMASIPHLSP